MMQAVEPGRNQAPAARLQRLAGFILDASLFWLFAATIVSVTQAIRAAFFLGEEGPNPTFAQLAETLASLASWLPRIPVSPLAIVLSLFGVYSLLWWWLAGTSPGKWLVGIELVRPDGRRPGFVRSLIRLIAIVFWIGIGLAVGLVVSTPVPRSLTELPILSLLGLVSWWPALVREDRAALHDLIAGTRAVKTDASGFRIMTRSTLHRALSDVRWAAAILALTLLGGTGLVFGTRALLQEESTPVAAAAPVDQVTQEAIKGALLEYNRMEEHATYRLDASILEPRATQSWLAKKQQDFAELRRRGIRQESRLLNADFKSFRWVGDNSIEADVVETWVTLVADVTGRQLQERAAHDVPQTAILVRDRGRWKLNNVRHYDLDESPF